MTTKPRDTPRCSAALGAFRCTCTPHPYGDGPEIDCMVHGPTCPGCGLKIGAGLQGRVVRSGGDDEDFYWHERCVQP